MQSLLAWDENEALDDAVLVTIWNQGGRVVADIACGRCAEAQDYMVADFPRPVQIALRRAEEVRQACRLSRILVKLAEGVEWQPGWGSAVFPQDSPDKAARHSAVFQVASRTPRQDASCSAG